MEPLKTPFLFPVPFLFFLPLSSIHIFLIPFHKLLPLSTKFPSVFSQFFNCFVFLVFIPFFRVSTYFSSPFQSPSFPIPFLLCQHAKKVVSDSPGLMDFAIGLVIFALNLPNVQVLFFGEIQIKDCNQSS